MEDFDLTNGTGLSMTITALSPATTGVDGALTSGERMVSATTLPLPDELKWTTELDWSPEDRNIVQNFVANFDDTRDQFSKDAQAFIGNLAKRFGAGALDAFGANRLLQDRGFAVDPLKEIFFNGVANRSYPLNWKLFAKNQREAIQIKAAIDSLKTSAHPESSGPGLFKLPDHFKIDFPGELNIPIIKDCVCTSITADFAAAGFGRFQRDGNASFITLTMTMMELEVPVKGDWS